MAGVCRVPERVSAEQRAVAASIQVVMSWRRPQSAVRVRSACRPHAVRVGRSSTA